MSDGGVSIAVHLGVKDEVELILPCIAHLRAIGAREFIVYDMMSRDGTRELLKQEEGDDLRVIDVGEDQSEQQLMMRIQAEVSECRADWLLLMDADEFPLPKGGDLRAALGRHEEDVVLLPRHNVALGPDGPRLSLPVRPDAYRDIDLYVGVDPDYRHKLEQDRALPWIAAVPAPKVAVRPKSVGRMIPGMHDVRPKPGSTLARSVATEITVAHLPLTSFERFRRKVINIRATFDLLEGQVGPNWGWHWRRWAAMESERDLRNEFENSVVSESSLAALRAAGTIKTAADLLGLLSAAS